MPDYRFTANLITYDENTQDVSEALQSEVVLSLGTGDSFSYAVQFEAPIGLPIVQTTLDYQSLSVVSLGRTYAELPDFEVFGEIIYPDDTQVTVLGFSYEEGDSITEITLCIDGDLRPIDETVDLAVRGRGGRAEAPFAPGDVIDLDAVTAGHGGEQTPEGPTAGDDEITGTPQADRIDALSGDDTIRARDGADTVIAGDGDDLVEAGETAQDLADVVFGGAGNDTIDGGYGNDNLRGDAGDDEIAGGFGADTVIGGDGDDFLTGGALGDLLFGGAGDDFLNGGFGFDRLNGGAGADRFFHLGIEDHGSDWIQDYVQAEGDVLVLGNTRATGAQFQINAAVTPGAGADDVAEAFVIYRPTGQIVWALVDGMGQDTISVQIGGDLFELAT